MFLGLPVVCGGQLDQFVTLKAQREPAVAGTGLIGDVVHRGGGGEGDVGPPQHHRQGRRLRANFMAGSYQCPWSHFHFSLHPYWGPPGALVHLSLLGDMIRKKSSRVGIRSTTLKPTNYFVWKHTSLRVLKFDPQSCHRFH